KSVSISWSVTAGSTTGSCNLNVDVVSDESGNPSDIKTITISSTGGDDNGNGGGGSVIGGGGPPGEKNASRRPILVPGVGLRDNAKLQAAIQKVLGLASLSEQARENLMRLSESISSQVQMTRNFRFANQVSSMETRMTYSGNQRAVNFMLFDTVPKEFAQHAGNITVTAAGATIEVVESDPEYLFAHDEFDPGQEIVITYSLDTEVDESVIDSFSGEVYAQALEEAPPTTCTEEATRCSMNDLQVCRSGEWVYQETCQYGCSGGACSTVPAGPADYMIWIIVGALLIGGVGVVVFLLKRKSSGARSSPVKSEAAKPLTPGEQPYRPGSMHYDFERD
ncbi:MAG: hypothetical protein KAT35_05760, partial [Candidatus Aenigmarchaeota archaeon]|nr:hypothetical protein [Candidatus Aenigmarchaeota archaeon]